MSNATATESVAWIVLPVFFSALLYASCVLWTWPLARGIIPLWFLVLLIFVPPLFPFILVYIFAFTTTRAVTAPVVVVEASTRGRVVARSVRSRGI